MKAKINNDGATVVSTDLDREIYNDAAKPLIKETGNTLALIPRTIRASLNRLEKWVICREHNIKAVEKLLNKKLKDCPEELIDEPESYVAVPALQGISYCMDNEELREMYANLLASSMRKDKKTSVHPSYANIIGQMSPLEAKLIKDFYKSDNDVIPIIKVDEMISKISGYEEIKNYSNFYEYLPTDPQMNGAIFENLERLGLLIIRDHLKISDKHAYDALVESDVIRNVIDHIKSNNHRPIIVKGSVLLSNFGNRFVKSCIE